MCVCDQNYALVIVTQPKKEKFPIQLARISQLCICGNNHILQQNIFIILSSLEMIATSRIFDILDVAICMPVRWLAGNTHKLAHHNWGAWSIGREF